MQCGIKLTAEYFDIETGKVLASTVISTEKIDRAATLKNLGYLHVEQIDLIRKIQDFKISHQILLNAPTTCGVCGGSTQKLGKFKSQFHSALTDHVVSVQRMHCKCGWTSPTSVEGIFGSNVHPDLLKKQAIQGSKESFEKSAASLDAESAASRSINNHSQIKRAVERVANVIVPIRAAAEPLACFPELIANIDGGHIKSIGKNRSFEAMIATVYRPESLVSVNENRNEIIDKTTVASAKDDSQKTMKQLFIGACNTQGMSIKSTVICLADGAENCRNIAYSIREFCKEIVYILDWFHISMKFQNIAMPEKHNDLFNRVNKNLWHGNREKAIQRLDELLGMEDIQDNTSLINKLEKLKTYIINNESGIVNYAERKRMGLVFTSNIAECSVNTLINERQKGKQKMLWSRDGAHNILQIRSSVFSKSWNDDWDKVESQLYPLAA